MTVSDFHELRFRAAVDRALKRVQQILDSTRTLKLADDACNSDHSYSDKFALVEFLGNTLLAATLTALERLGLDPVKWNTAASWANKKKNVTLLWQMKESCEFVKQTQVDVKQPVQMEKDTYTTSPDSSKSGFFIGQPTKTTNETSRVVVKMIEYHWKVTVTYTIVIYTGTDASKGLVLDTRTTSTIQRTSGGQAVPSRESNNPRPPLTAQDVKHEVDLSWLWKHIGSTDQVCQFQIDRQDKDCRTPLRNKPTLDLLESVQQFGQWSMLVGKSLLIQERQLTNHTKLVPMQKTLCVGAICIIQGLRQQPTFNGQLVKVLEIEPDGKCVVEPAGGADSKLPSTLRLKPSNLNVQSDGSNGIPPSTLATVSNNLCLDIFIPLIPLFEKGSVLDMADVSGFLAEQGRSLDSALDQLSDKPYNFSPRTLAKLVTVAEASILVVSQHLFQLANMYQDSVNYVEWMLEQQLLAAIGKEVQIDDFTQFTKYNTKRLFGPQYTSKPLSLAVRQPNHDPDGYVSIEHIHENDGTSEPVQTFCRTVTDTDHHVKVVLNASTSVRLQGSRHLHGWMIHKFANTSHGSFQISSRARQFSSFMLILGRMAGPDEFAPKQALILHNKDEVIIPLLLDTIPTSKEFKDAISSLSPEQKAFAEAFRQMQLESSVFGIAIVQLKPQLEKLLGLSAGSLTKEIQLTQDLMSLFVEYQIPSDLLSYDGPSEATTREKVANVKENVKAVLDVIKAAKEKDLADEIQKADMRAEVDYHPAVLSPQSEELDLMSAGMMADSAQEMGPMMAMSMSMPMSANAVPFSAVRMNRSMVPPGPSMRRKNEASQSTQQKSLQPSNNNVNYDLNKSDKAIADTDNFTLIPKLLDNKVEQCSIDDSIRTTIIKTGEAWTKRSQKNLLLPMSSTTMWNADIDTEKKKAFDLLDALTKSGSLPIDCAELHVIIAMSHCFDSNVMSTIIQDNINPIAKVEQSSLLMASVIHNKPAQQLIADRQDIQRLTTSIPTLFADER